MRALLSLVASACVAVLVGLSILPGPVQRPHPTGLGGINSILVPAGDDGPGGH